MITKEMLIKIIEYDKYSGLFKWIKRNVDMFSHCKNPMRACKTWNTRFSGTIAGSVFNSNETNTEYIAITILVHGIKKRRYLAHKLAFLYINGDYNCGIVDHIDHNGLNNSWSNLRIVGHVENKKNACVKKNNTSGFNGVVWNKNKGKWQVQVSMIADGKRKCVYGGLFENFEDAIEKRKQMNIQYGFHENHGKS